MNESQIKSPSISNYKKESVKPYLIIIKVAINVMNHVKLHTKLSSVFWLDVCGNIKLCLGNLELCMGNGNVDTKFVRSIIEEASVHSDKICS